MAVAWTTIPAGDVDIDSPLTTALIIALRDNPEGIAQRATGAPKIFGVPYDYQEFLTGGTWTKPSAAVTGDRVVVHVIAGGGSGRNTAAGAGFARGGGGGGGLMKEFSEIDDLSASVTVVVGAGGAARTTTNTNGLAGGASSFDAISETSIEGSGGAGGTTSVAPTGDALWGDKTYNEAIISPDTSISILFGGGSGGTYNNSNGNANVGAGSWSLWAGQGGWGRSGDVDHPYDRNGKFPGGGGAGSKDTGPSGAGAAGVVRVWCYRAEA